jgi:transposase
MNPAKPYADFVVKLITRYPTLADVRKAGRARIRKLFYGLGSRERIEQRIAALFENIPLTTDQVLLECGACKAQVLAAQLEILNQSIRQYDRRICQVLQQHDRFPVFDSLPCGSNSKARLIAALGDDLSRFGSAQELAAAVGIAPITTQSGKSRYVSSRWACSKFLRQTFHEFAGITIPRCAWSKAFYESQMAKGKSARMAKRALANKWIRIIFRCWQSGTPYNEAQYLKRLQTNHSPLFAKIAS